MDALKDQTLIASQLSKLRLGETQQFKNITVIPLFSSVNHSPEYLTLKEALEKNLTTITEVGLGGSVPELKVTNLADLPVLLVDGEELIGAKQNRILNTTILLREKSVTVIPVTCTESGRWHHTTHQFSHSDHIMSAKIRKLKSSHVTTSLKHALGYMADQGAIWGEVHVMASHAKVQSPTHALHEVFQAKTPQMNDYVTAFKPVPGQNGLLVFVNGVVVGLDVVSLERAYQVLHPSLIKSYAIDAVLAPTDKSSEQAAEKATAFLGEAAACKESKHPSIGYGVDYRFEGPKVAGSALVHDEKVIHLALFSVDRGDSESRTQPRPPAKVHGATPPAPLNRENKKPDKPEPSINQ